MSTDKTPKNKRITKKVTFKSYHSIGSNIKKGEDY